MENKMSMKEYLRALGPAIVIAAVVVGPGTVTTASTMGANYGYSLLWVIVFSALAAFFYQLPAINITLNRGVTILEAIRIRFGKKLAIVMFAAMYFCACISQAANFIGAAMALNYFVPAISLTGWCIITVLAALIMVLCTNYGWLENFTKVLIIMMVCAFVFTVIGSKPSISEIASQGFSFKIPEANFYLVLAMLSTTMVYDIPITLSALHKQKYLNSESPESRLSPEKKRMSAKMDLIVGTIVTAVLTSTILICSACNLHPLGIKVSSAADMAAQLTPILGRYAGILFSLGLWGAAFSSGMFRMELTPMLYNQATDQPMDKKALRSRICILGAGIVPIIFIMLFGAAPAQLIIAVQAITGLLLPFICGIVWRISSDKKFMGEFANKTWFNVVMGLIFVVTISLAIRVFLNLLGMI